MAPDPHGCGRWQATGATGALGGRRRKLRREPGAPGPVGIPWQPGHWKQSVLLTPLWVSLGGALTNPALGLSVPARFAEWLRDHGGGSLVNTAENWWYTHHQPPVGGQPLAAALPAPQHTRVVATGVRHHSPVHLPVPAALTPFASPALPGEGAGSPSVASYGVSRPFTRRSSGQMRCTQASLTESPGWTQGCCRRLCTRAATFPAAGRMPTRPPSSRARQARSWRRSTPDSGCRTQTAAITPRDR